jgi:hypothetical protein
MIWLAGLSGESFSRFNMKIWSTTKHFWSVHLLLMMHLTWKDVPQIAKKAKKSRGARRRKMVPSSYPEQAHHSIHRVKDLEKPQSTGQAPTAGPSTVLYTPKPGFGLDVVAS